MPNRSGIRVLSALLLLAVAGVAAWAEETPTPPPDDPVFAVLNQLRQGQQPTEAAAAVVELGDAPDFIKPSAGQFAVPVEEAAPPSRQRSQSAPRPGDPEIVRGQTVSLWPEPPVMPASSPLRRDRFMAGRPQPGDPESGRPLPKGTEKLGANTDRLAETGAQKKEGARPVESDRPRFAAQAADAALPGARPAEKSAEAEPTATAARTPGAAAAPAGTTPTGTAPVRSSEEAEQRYTDAMKQIETARPEAEQALREARDTTVNTGQGEELRVRDPGAAALLEAMLKNVPLGTISGQILDPRVRQPLPAFVRIVDRTQSAAGAPLPDGFWCDGQFSTQLLSGPVKLDVRRGRFWPTFVKGVRVEPQKGEVHEIPLTRPPMLNFAARNWHLLDLNLGLEALPSEQRIWLGPAPTLDDLSRAARAADVAVVGVRAPVRALEAGSDWTQQIAQASGTVVLLPVLNGPRHLFSGCAMGIGMKSCADMVVERTRLNEPLRESFEEIRARDGLAVYTDLIGRQRVGKRDLLSLLPSLEKSYIQDLPEGSFRLYGAAELPHCTVTGPAYDLLEFDGQPWTEKIWFNLLENGYRIPIVGAGTGSLESGRLPFGQMLVEIEGAPTREKTVAALRKGASTVTFGPAVFCRVLERDMGPGAVLPTDGRALTLQVRAYSSLEPGMQLDSIEVIRNGVVVQTQQALENESEINDLRVPISETTPAWYVVRVRERKGFGARAQRGASAWTNPIYFQSAQQPRPRPAQSRISGQLKSRGLFAKGSVTVLVAGEAPRAVATDKEGRFSVQLPASGSLIFEAPGCEPVARRVFEHPKVQRALLNLLAERDGPLWEQLAKRTMFESWALLLSELTWDVDLAPAGSGGN